MCPDTPGTANFDRRAARWLIRPLVNTPVSPNMLTSLGLLFGLAAAFGFATGYAYYMNLAAVAYLLAEFMDHMDGELARLAGKTSAFGHVYDEVASGTTKTLMFVGIGVGIRHGALGNWSVLMGIIAGISVCTIFIVMAARPQVAGKSQTSRLSCWGFDLEDVLYLVAPVTWVGALTIFLTVAAIGAPVFAIWMLYRAVSAPHSPCPETRDSNHDG